MVITSRENKIFKLVKALLSKRGRDENKRFMIEGLRSVLDAAKKNAPIEYIIVKDGVNISEELKYPTYTFAPKLFCELSDTQSPQGIMAVCKNIDVRLSDIKGKEKSCVILCEALQDPGNIGTIIRTAHAGFCDGVVFSKGCCDLYNPKVVRATMSGIFSLPVVCAVETDEAIRYFKGQGYKCSAGALSERSVDLFSSSLTGKQLIIIGNEANGVREETLKKCDSVIKIPMNEDAESLNAAIAASVIIYEYYRQNN